MKSAKTAQESEIRAVLSSQTYGPIDPQPSQTLRMAVMHASNNGVKWVSDVSEDKMGYGAARNSAVEQVLEAVKGGEEIDYLVWIDSDIICEPDTITRLLWTAVEYKHDFLTGIYHQKGGAFQPVIYTWHQKWWPRWGSFSICDGYPQDTVAPIGGCGFGICCTSVKMLQDMQDSKHFPKDEGKWFRDNRDNKGGFGEDLSFCFLAMRCNYQLYVDTRIQVGHQGAGQVFDQKYFNDYIKKRMSEDGHTVE